MYHEPQNTITRHLSSRNQNLHSSQILYPNICSSFIITASKEKQPKCLSIDKQINCFPFRGILLSNETKGMTQQHGWISRLQRRHSVWCHLHDNLEKKDLQEENGVLGLAGCGYRSAKGLFGERTLSFISAVVADARFYVCGNSKGCALTKENFLCTIEQIIYCLKEIVTIITCASQIDQLLSREEENLAADPELGSIHPVWADHISQQKPFILSPL